MARVVEDPEEVALVKHTFETKMDSLKRTVMEGGSKEVRGLLAGKL